MKIVDFIFNIGLKLKAAMLYSKINGSDSVYYINGVPLLPEPMTKAEEKECFEALLQGREEVRDKLIVHNLRLVVYIAKKFENSSVNLEDLISIGTVGLIKAVRTFCPDKNIKLATYASRCIENEILMYLRKVSNMKADISIDEPLNVDWDGNELLLSDVLSTGADVVSDGLESEDEIRTLMNCIGKLNERERRIICMRFGLCGSREYTQKEVADTMGISQSYISRIEKRIIEELKASIEKELSPV